jgi:argininosuccinate lyase
MRNTWKKMLAASVMSVTLLGTYVPVHAEGNTPSNKEAVQLTAQQKKELELLYKDIFDKRKQVIGKYVKYGILPEEKGQKIIAHLQKHYEKLEQNGFIPHWDHSKKGHAQ